MGIVADAIHSGLSALPGLVFRGRKDLPAAHFFKHAGICQSRDFENPQRDARLVGGQREGLQSHVRGMIIGFLVCLAFDGVVQYAAHSQSPIALGDRFTIRHGFAPTELLEYGGPDDSFDGEAPGECPERDALAYSDQSWRS